MTNKYFVKLYREAVLNLIDDLKDKYTYGAMLECMCNIATEEINKEMNKEFPELKGYSYEVY